MAFWIRRSASMFLGLAAAALGLGSATAGADELKPSPYVTSPGSSEVRKGGTQGEVRDGDILAPAGGEVRQSPKAVPSAPGYEFKGARVGPGIGGWEPRMPRMPH